MKDETLFDMARSNIIAANMLIKNSGDDDRFVNFAAYHTQQAYELTLKHFLEINSIKYGKEHDIRSLIDLGIANNICFPLSSYLNEQADVITLMEAKTRYLKNYRSSLTTVNNAINNFTAIMATAFKIMKIPDVNCVIKEIINNYPTVENEASNMSDTLALARDLSPTLTSKILILGNKL